MTTPKDGGPVCGSWERDAGWDSHWDAHSTRRCVLPKGHAGPHDYSDPAPPSPIPADGVALRGEAELIARYRSERDYYREEAAALRARAEAAEDLVRAARREGKEDGET